MTRCTAVAAEYTPTPEAFLAPGNAGDEDEDDDEGKANDGKQ